MKVEKWEEETDEEWTQRLAEEVALANNTEASKYFVERDPYAEDAVIINYVGETSWTWKEHPEGPFTAAQILGWKNKAKKWVNFYEKMKPTLEKAEKYDDLMEKSMEAPYIDCVGNVEKLEAITNWYNKTRFRRGQLPHDAWIALYKILEGMDESTIVVPLIRSSEFTTKDEDKK